jgi:hypothetical protein
MKRIVLILMAIMIAKFAGAQLWNVNLNSFTGTATPKLGTSSNHSINFYTNNMLKMKLDSNGILQVNSLASTGANLLIANATGGLHPIPGGTSSQILFGNLTWGNLPGAISSFNTNVNGDVYVNPGLKFGIGTTTPIIRLDVSGDGKVDNSFGVGQNLYLNQNDPNNDYGVIRYYPKTANNPAVFNFSTGQINQSGNPVTWTGGGGHFENDPPLVTFPCANGETPPNVANVMQEWLYIQKQSPAHASLGNINIGHNGTNGFIETEGTNPASPSAGDLLINSKCNRNVYLFFQQIPFMPGINNIMGVSGRVHVTGSMQLGVGNVTSFLEPSYQLYVGNAPNNGGIKIKQGNPGQFEAGLKIISLGTSAAPSINTQKAIVIHHGISTSDGPERFSVQGDGKTLITTTNPDAFTIADGANSNQVNFKVNQQGNTFIGNGINAVTNSKLVVAEPVKTNKALSIVDNSNLPTIKEVFNVYGNGYTEINVSSPLGMPTPYGVTNPRALTIRDVTNNKDIFVVRSDGKTYAREVEINLLSTFPDYVFSDNYNLKSISEVENYITEHKHLPGFEKGEYYEKNGMNVNDMFIKQQEKIEEMTLYIIQLEKRLKAIEKN